MQFFKRLEAAWTERGTALCVGLDPRLRPGEGADDLYRRSKAIVDATARYAACFKPNVAFYEAFGAAGIDALVRLVKSVPDGVPVLLDAKRCDIGPTAEAYAKACFEAIGADAVTLSPYMGRDAVDPFLAYEDKAVFLLARTSNPRAGVFQDVDAGGLPLYALVARECSSWSDRVGLVAAGNDVQGMAVVRAAAPGAWLLAPGIGAQGGDIATAWKAGARSDGMGVLPVAARSVAEAADSGAAAADLVASMKKAAEGATRATGVGFDGATLLKKRIMRGLLDTGCFKTGSFVLKSGKTSPFYIDLRRVISDPSLLDAVAQAYALASEGAAYDRVAGIPAAALPLATATSMRLRVPMVWPRMPAKDHGTGVRVEGAFNKGERALLLDDLITTGTSKIEAIEILRGEGLVVEDLVVLIERGKQGRRDMETAGVRLRSFMHVRELFALCEELGTIDRAERERLEAFADAE
ncbi:MAG: orotidine-5'-phosphate decarboxylase [Spirochaetes bacterium]|nr:orotidine-5'-phosphate decarboxylase [Spirochaetota bacterium]MBU1081462.1 orotidine-5'-phosphate decarboxylase [Spirochaetota bacterium]